MDNRFETYSTILLSSIVCIAFSCFFPSTSIAFLPCLLCSLAVVVIGITSKKAKRKKSSYRETLLDCEFLLSNYEITKNNRTIFEDFLNDAASNINEYILEREARKLNCLMKEKQLPAGRFSEMNNFYIVCETIGFCVTTFGICGMISSAIPYLFFNSTLIPLFWISLLLLILGILVLLFLVGDIDNHKVLSVISGIVALLLLVSLLIPVFINKHKAVVEQQEREEQCTDLIICITQKLDSAQQSSYMNGYLCTFEMLLTNGKAENISTIEGELKIYNRNGYLLDASTLKLSERILSGETKTFLITVDRPSSENVIELYYSSADDLKITFKVRSICFNGLKVKEYPNSAIMEILSPSSTTPTEDTSNPENTLSGVETTYSKAVALYQAKKYSQAKEIFETIIDYKDSRDYIFLCEDGIYDQECSDVYEKALSLLKLGKYAEAIEKFNTIYDYRDSAEQIALCNAAIQNQKLENSYITAINFYKNKEYVKAYTTFFEIVNYKDSENYLYSILQEVNDLAISYANFGEYKKSYDLLGSIGYTTTKNSQNYSRLMDACNSAYHGDYKSAVNYGLTKIVIPEGTVSIDAYLFEGCTGLVEIVMPDSITSIGAYAFNGCTSLSKITFSKNLKNIGRSAFANCDTLEKLILPISLTSIVTYGLNSIDGEIHYEGTMAQWKALSKDAMGSILRKNIHCKDGIILNEEN